TPIPVSKNWSTMEIIAWDHGYRIPGYNPYMDFNAGLLNMSVNSVRMASLGVDLGTAGAAVKNSERFILRRSDIDRIRCIGTTTNPGEAGGAINPAGLEDNCVPCVGAVLHNKFNIRGRNFYTAQRISREHESVGRYTNPIQNDTEAIAYFERNLGLTSTF